MNKPGGFKVKKDFQKCLAASVFLGLVGCAGSNTSTLTSDSNASLATGSIGSSAILRFKLTDAPKDDLKSVFVNIDHLEVMLEGRGKSGRIKVASNLGLVDLLKLQNGITMLMQDVVIPEGYKINQLRLILKESGHFSVKMNDSICTMKAPSADKTGIKIKLAEPVMIEAGNQYSLLIDFDAAKSVVLQGNGGCLLKPVLKLASIVKIVVDKDEDGQVDEDVNVDDESGGEDVTPVDPVETVPVDTPPADTAPADTAPVDDGWDYTPVIDGQDLVL